MRTAPQGMPGQPMPMGQPGALFRVPFLFVVELTFSVYVGMGMPGQLPMGQPGLAPGQFQQPLGGNVQRPPGAPMGMPPPRLFFLQIVIFVAPTLCVSVGQPGNFQPIMQPGMQPGMGQPPPPGY